MAAALKCVLIGLLVALSILGPASAKRFGSKPSQFAYEITTEKFDNCPRYHNLKNTFVNLTLWAPPNEAVLLISGTMILGVPLDDSPDYKYVVNLKRCLGEDWSRCEKYLVIDVENMCRHLPAREQMWSAVVEKLEDFDPHCPIKPGTYNFEDAPLDSSQLNKVESARGHWQMEMRVTFKDEVIFCVTGNAMISVKSQNKSG